MPTPEAFAREDRVIDLVVAYIEAGNTAVRVVDRPDRNTNRTDRLTVDAQLEVGAEQWAMDVVTLRWRSGLERDVQKLRAALDRAFGTALDAKDQTLVVGGKISSEPAALQRLIELAGRAVQLGQDQVCEDQMAELYPRVPGVDRVEIWPLLATTGDMQLEFVSSSGEPLARKLTRQLHRAAEPGYRTCLALDQKGAADLEYGANWLPQYASTVLSAVTQVESDAGVAADFVVLIRPDDSVEGLRR